MDNTTYPIVYKTIPTQYIFLVLKTGLLKITPVTNTPREIQFKDEREAREYIKNYNVQL